MLKKIALGSFIVYSMFSMTVSAFAMEFSIDYKADPIKMESSKKELIDSENSSTTQPVLFDDVQKEISSSDDSKNTENFKDIKGVKSINNNGVSIATNTSNSSSCDSTGTPNVTVVSPNGGEVYNVGQQVTVKWISCNIPSNYNWNIILMNAPASTMYPIAMNTQNDGEETFTIPSQTQWSNPIDPDFSYGNNFKILISAFNPPNNWPAYVDYSNSFFTVNSPVVNTPSITVVSPNGGEVYQVGQQINITWNSQNIPTTDTISISMVSDIPSLPGVPVPGLFVPNTGNAQWTATLNQSLGWVSGAHYKIKISHYPINAQTPDAFDLSDNLFTIQSHVDTTGCDSTNTDGSITVLSPNGGELYTAGQQMTVTWNTCNVPADHNVIIILKNMDNNTIIYLTNDPNVPSISTPNDGQETFILPTSVYSGLITGNYKISLSSLALNNITGVYDESDSTFRINGLNPSITVVSPNGGEMYQSGQRMTVHWNSSNIPANTLLEVNIYEFNTPIFGFLAPHGTPNDGEETFTLPASLPAGSDYSIIVGVPLAGFDNSALSVWDQSDGSFTISDTTPFCNPDESTTVPAVDIISPNGGEHYLPVEMPVTWRTCMISNTTQMKIDLLMHNSNGTISIRNLATTINDGNEVVPLPNTTTWSEMVYGNNFKVRIYPVNSPSYGPLDQSDNKFTIEPASVLVDTDPNTPASSTILVNNTASTNNINLFKFRIKAQGSDLSIRKIPIILTSGASANIASVVNTIKLYNGTNLIDSVDGSSGSNVLGGVITNGPCTTTCGFIFQNMPGTTVNMGTTQSFTITLDIKALNGNYPNGFYLTGSILNGDVLTPTHFSVLDILGDQLTPSQRSGFAQGQTQFFNTECVNTVMGTTSVTSTLDSGGNVTMLTYNIPLSITSCNSTRYMSQNPTLSVIASGQNSIAYVFNNSSSPSVPNTTSISSATLSSSDAVIEGNAFRIDAGTTKHFALTVKLNTPSVLNSYYRVALKQIRTFSNSVLTNGGMSLDLVPPSSYQTQFAFINN